MLTKRKRAGKFPAREAPTSSEVGDRAFDDDAASVHPVHRLLEDSEEGAENHSHEDEIGDQAADQADDDPLDDFSKSFHFLSFQEWELTV